MIKRRQTRRTDSGEQARLKSLEALSSPIRQEILSELGDGGASVKDLSVRLGRSRQTLHFHIGVLQKAGLIEPTGTRGAGRSEEAVYRVSQHKADLRSPCDLSRREREYATRAAQALLRMTQREVARAMRHEDFSRSQTPVAMAIRAKARLDTAGMKQLHALIQELCDLFRASKGKNLDQRPTAVTLVLTPTRDSTARAKPKLRKDAR